MSSGVVAGSMMRIVSSTVARPVMNSAVLFQLVFSVLSSASVSLLKRCRMRPSGVTSKKLVRVNSTARSSRPCSSRAAARPAETNASAFAYVTSATAMLMPAYAPR